MMSNTWSKNLIFLREQKGLGQLEAATALDLTRSTYAKYETGRHLPNLETVRNILEYFGVDFNNFFYQDLEKVRNNKKSEQEIESDNLRKDVRKQVRKDDQILKPTLETLHAWIASEYYVNSLGDVYDFSSSNDVKLITYILKNYENPLVKEMAALQLPDLGSGIHIRVPITVDNMHPTLKTGDKVVATYLPEPATTLREGYIYLLVDKVDGLICKRIYKASEDSYELVSDNKIYKPYKRDLNDIIALFKVIELHTRNFYNEKEANEQESFT